MSTVAFPDQQWTALQDLYDSLNGQYWAWHGTGKVWNFSDPQANPCTDQWMGIVCNCSQIIDISSTFFDALDRFHIETTLVPIPPLPVGNCSSHPSTNHSVTGINLGGQNLTGTLPPSIRNLTSLVVLNMSVNSIYGTIPEEMYELKNLEVLHVSVNRLHGSLSANISQLQQLQVFNVLGNLINGTIPSQIGTLSRLMELEVSINQLTGVLSTSLCAMKALKYLHINTNDIEGSIPTCLYSSTMLEQIALHDNYLTGTLSENLSMLTNLKVLEVSDNLLDGELPKALAQMTQLQILSLSYNLLHGDLHLAELMGTGSAIVDFDVGNNFFEGSLPAKYVWPNLRRYYAFSNQLTGTIPTYTLINAPNIHLIDLGTNYLTGNIPVSLDTLVHLYNLLLFENLLSGHIKHINFANYQQMFAFIVFNNTLTGPLPESFGQMNRLYCLGLYNNEFTGTFPASFANINGIGQIVIQNNKFSGPLTHVLGENMTRLQFIDVSANSFTGTLPTQSIRNYYGLHSLALASNCLQGDITPFLTQLCEHNKNLQAIALDGLNTGKLCRNPIFGELSSWFPTRPFSTRNNMGGTLPSCLFHQMPRLNILHLGGNQMTGSLPSDVNISTTLLDFTISHNKFTQPIPANFLLHTWANFDLSFNRFNGTLEPMVNLDINATTMIDQVNQVTPIYFRYKPSWLPSPKDRRNPNIYPNQIAYSNISIALHVNRLSGPIPAPLQGLTSIQILRGNTFSCNQLDKSAQLPTHDPEFDIYSCGSEAMSNTLIAMVLVSIIPIGFLCFALYRCWKAKTLQQWLTKKGDYTSRDIRCDSDVRNSEFQESQTAFELTTTTSFSSPSENNSTVDRTKSKASSVQSFSSALKQRTISAMAAESQHLWRIYDSESADTSRTISTLNATTTLAADQEGHAEASEKIPVPVAQNQSKLSKLCSVCFTIYDAIVFVYQQLMHPTVFLEFDVDQLHSGVGKCGGASNDDVELNVHIASFHYLTDNIRIGSLYLTLFIIVVMMTMYSSLNVYYKTHEYSYLWKYSAVWLRGEVAATVLTIFFALFIAVSTFVIRKYIISYHGSVNPNYLYNRDIETMLQQSVVEESASRQQSTTSTVPFKEGAANTSHTTKTPPIIPPPPSLPLPNYASNQPIMRNRMFSVVNRPEYSSFHHFLHDIAIDIGKAAKDFSKWLLFYFLDFLVVIIVDIFYVYMFVNYDGIKVLLVQFAVSLVKLYWNDNLSIRCFIWYKLQLMQQAVLCYNIQYSIATKEEIEEVMASANPSMARTISMALPKNLPTKNDTPLTAEGRTNRRTNVDQLVDQIDSVRETVSFINHVPYKITINAHEGSIFDPDMQNPFRQTTTNRFTTGGGLRPSSRMTIPDEGEEDDEEREREQRTISKDERNSTDNNNSILRVGSVSCTDALVTSYCVSIAILPHVDILRLSDVSILNKIAIPCFAVALISNSCFYDALVQQNAVTSETYFCFPLPSVGVPCVNIIGSYADGTSFNPAFVYSFQCASAFIRYYAPIYIYLMTFSTVLIPFFFCLFRYVYVQYFQDDIESYAEYHELYGHDENYVGDDNATAASGNESTKDRPIAYPTARGSIYATSNSSMCRRTNSGASTKPRKTSYWLRLIHYMLPLEWYAHTLNHFHHLTQRMSNKQQLVIRLTAYIGILISFGALFPLLSIVMCISIYMVTIVEQRKTHRLLQQSYKLKYPVYSIKLTQECKEFCSSFKQNLRRCVAIATLFMGYFAFDTLGDSSGWKMGVIPLVLLMAFTISLQTLMRRKVRGFLENQMNSRSKTSPEMDLNGLHSSAEGDMIAAHGEPVDEGYMQSAQSKQDHHEVNNPIFASTLITETAVMNANGTASI